MAAKLTGVVVQGEYRANCSANLSATLVIDDIGQGCGGVWYVRARAGSWPVRT